MQNQDDMKQQPPSNRPKPDKGMFIVLGLLLLSLLLSDTIPHGQLIYMICVIIFLAYVVSGIIKRSCPTFPYKPKDPTGPSGTETPS